MAHWNDPRTQEGFVPQDDPREAAFFKRQEALAPSLHANTPQEFVAAMRARRGGLSQGERQLVQDIERNPNGYEFKAGRLRKKSRWDFIGNHPFLTVGAFLGAAAAPALFAGAAGGAAGGGAAGVATVGGSTGAAATGGSMAFWSPTTLKLFGLGVGAGTNLIGGWMQSRGATNAAKEQRRAVEYGSDRELEASDRALLFERQQAQQMWMDAERTQRANYDQWAARQRALNDFRRKYEYGVTDIPDYVPGTDPNYTGGEGPLPPDWREQMAPPQASQPQAAQPRSARRPPIQEVGAYLTPQYQSYGQRPLLGRRGLSIGSYLR